MTIPLFCLFIAAMMPIFVSGVSNFQRKKQFGTLDNHNPREQSAMLTGLGARAMAAQSNCWEALMMFTAALAAAYLKHIDGTSSVSEIIAIPCVLFILARISFIYCYLKDLPKLRSPSFGIGFICCIWLFWI